jgi:hypothetical protein
LPIAQLTPDVEKIAKSKAQRKAGNEERHIIHRFSPSLGLAAFFAASSLTSRAQSRFIFSVALRRFGNCMTNPQLVPSHYDLLARFVVARHTVKRQ